MAKKPAKKARVRKPAAKRSRGAVALLRTGQPHEVLARELETSRPNITSLLAGRWKPGDKVRELARAKYGIEPPWWDEPWDADAGTPRAPLVDLSKLPTSAEAHIVMLREHILTRWAQLADPKAGAVPLEAAKTAKALAEALSELAKAEKELADAKAKAREEIPFVQLPCFDRLEQLIVKHLSKHPDTLRAWREDVEKERLREVG